MTATANTLPCIEIQHYRTFVVDGRYIVSYEQRQPGDTAWQPVVIERAARPEDRPTVSR